MKASIGILVHNEEKNIGQLLKLLLNERYKFKLQEIIVVASGCTDRSVEIVRNFSKKNNRIKLFVEKYKKGVTSATNIILKKATGDIIVFICGDNFPDVGSLNKIVKPLRDKNIVASMGRRIPYFNQRSLSQIFNSFVSEIYHATFLKVSGFFTDLGAIKKNVIKELPKYILSEDLFMEAFLRKNNFKFIYIPEAITYAMREGNIFDFLKRRRRYYIYNKQLENAGYHMPHVLRYKIRILLNIMLKNPFLFFAGLCFIFFEALARTGIIFNEYRVLNEIRK